MKLVLVPRVAPGTTTSFSDLHPDQLQVLLNMINKQQEDHMPGNNL